MRGAGHVLQVLPRRLSSATRGAQRRLASQLGVRVRTNEKEATNALRTRHHFSQYIADRDHGRRAMVEHGPPAASPGAECSLQRIARWDGVGVVIHNVDREIYIMSGRQNGVRATRQRKASSPM